MEEQNNHPQPMSQQPIQSPTQNSKSHIFIMVLIGLLLLGAGFGGGFFLFSNKNSSQKPVSLSQVSPGITESLSPTPQQFKKRLYDVHAFVFDTNGGGEITGNQSFPAELVGVLDEKLVGIRCSGDYHGKDLYKGGMPFGYMDSQNNFIELKDQTLLTVISKLEAKVQGNFITSFQVCETENRQLYIKYGQQQTGGGAGEKVYFAKVNKDDTITSSINLSGSSAYFGCSQPLQLRTSGLLYYKCGGENYQVIYKIYLGEMAPKKVVECNLELSPQKIICKNYAV